MQARGNQKKRAFAPQYASPRVTASNPMPKWWPEFARDAGIKVNKNATLEPEKSEYSGLTSQPYISSAVTITPTLPASQAEETLPHATHHTGTSLPTQASSQYVSASEMHSIESQDRLWEVEEILQVRLVKGRGLHAKHNAKQYLIQWTPSWLSTEEFHYARKTWKIVKTL